MEKRLNLAFWSLLLACLMLLSTLVFAEAEDWLYTIRSGDNLRNLTEKHLTSFKYFPRLQQLNKIQNPYRIPPGSNIRIPPDQTKQQLGKARIVKINGIAILQRNNSQKKIPIELGLPLVITLNPLSGAKAYRAQIANNNSFQDLIADFTIATILFREGDIPNGSYWLRRT